jgi:hypothetical protein
MSDKIDISKEKLQLTGFLKDKFPKIGFIVGGIALFISLILGLQDPHHVFSSYLTAFSLFTTISLGAMFFVLIQFLTRSGWSVVVRRVPEVLMSNISLMAIFFIPILFGLHDLYHWTHTEAVASDHLLQGKAPYLNVTFFVLRAVFFFGIWTWISNTFSKGSQSQDESGDPAITLALQKKSTFCVIIFGLTLTFSAVDWIMSLTPHWYSTIFGVYIFSGALVVSFAVTSLLYMILRRNGFLKNIVSLEHFQDLGKFLYGFNVFWAYIAFSQYFLIWYANIPEETVWFVDHFAGSWNAVAMLLAIGHFGVPFVLFMSKHAKRNLKFHAIIASWLIFMHILDLYWIIMPNVSKAGIHVSIADITTIVGIGGIYFAVVFKKLASINLIPVKDPRLEESLSFENA